MVRWVVVAAAAILSAAPVNATPHGGPGATLPGGNCVMPPAPTRPGEGRIAAGAAPAALPPLPASLAPRRAAASGTSFVPVILIDFPDRDSTIAPAEIEKRLFDVGGAARSVRDYYRETSHGQFEFTGEVAGWFHSAQLSSYYTNDDNGFDTSPSARTGPHDKNVWGLIEEAVGLADPAVDFRRYDRDGDGVVDAVIFVLAGVGAEYSRRLNDFWSHKFDLRDCLDAGCYPFGGQGLSADGMTIGPYVVVPEIGEIGVVCHEFGHILGLPDLYITDVESQPSPLGSYGLMDYGGWMDDPDDTADRPGSLPSHFCAWSKYMLGWIDPPSVSEEEGVVFSPDVRLPEVARGTATEPGVFRLLANPGGEDWDRAGNGSGRYFLVENRGDAGFDHGLFHEYYLQPRESGLLVTFIDESRDDTHVPPDSTLLYVVQADGESVVGGGLPHRGEGTDLWPREGMTPDRFDAATVTSYGVMDAELAHVVLDDITIGADGAATFDAWVTTASTRPALVADVTQSTASSVVEIDVESNLILSEIEAQVAAGGETDTVAMSPVGPTGRDWRGTFALSTIGPHELRVRGQALGGADSVQVHTFQVARSVAGMAGTVVSPDGAARLSLEPDVAGGQFYLADLRMVSGAPVYVFGPEDLTGRQWALELAYAPGAFTDLNRLFIFHRDATGWHTVPSRVFPVEGVVRAVVSQLGSFRLGIDPTFTGSNLVTDVVLLHAARPNPFRPSYDGTVAFSFDLPGTRRVRLTVYDVLGRRIRTLVDEGRGVGTYVETWNGKTEDGRNVSPGVYFYRLETDGRAASRKIILAR